jgi:hypothetical protein
MKSDKETKKLPIRRGTVVTVLLGLLVGTALAVSDSGTFELGDEVVQPGSADILSSDQAGPDWTDLFNADGTLKDEYPLDESGNPSGNGVPDYQELYGGEWAVFMTDDVSLGTNPETTALAGSDDLVQNATAEVDHDLRRCRQCCPLRGRGASGRRRQLPRIRVQPCARPPGPRRIRPGRAVADP